MAADPNKLRTHAECDKAKTSLENEMDRYEVKDVNLDFSDRQAERIADDVTKRLADAEADITSANQMLALPNLSDKRRKAAQADLRLATYRRDTLQARDTTNVGVDAFLADVDADQNAAQLQVLTEAIAKVEARRAELSA